MFCSECGCELSDNVRFCVKCGEPVGNKWADDFKTVKLRCQDCNGIMNVDRDKEIISCPYCGSARMLLESDDVRIEKIKSNKMLETLRIKKAIAAEKHEQYMAKQKHLGKLAAIVWIILFLIVGIPTVIALYLG